MSKQRRSPRYVEAGCVKVETVTLLSKQTVIHMLADYLHWSGIQESPKTKTQLYRILQTQVLEQVDSAPNSAVGKDMLQYAEYLVGKYFPEIAG